jgi:hypothetical protein
MIGKSNTKPPITSDPIQLSSDHESPHKKLKEESEPAKEIKSEPVTPSLPQKATVTPSSQVPKPSTKCDMPSTSTEKPKPSPIEQSDQSPTVEQLQKENAQLIQRLAEHETMDRHLHHDNIVLQAKVNSLQCLVDQMTTTNHSLRMQLKHRKRPKKKSPGHEGEAPKA